MRIYLSPTQLAAADNCRRQHWYRHIAKVRVAAEPANFAFGNAVDRAVRDYLNALTLGHALPDPMSDFITHWETYRKTQELVYAATHTPEKLRKMGEELMRAFPGAWEQSGLEVAVGLDDRPLLDLRLDYYVGRIGELEVWLSNVLDLVAYTRTGALAVADIKSAAQPHTPVYARRSDQLTSYQLALNHHARSLGISSAEQLGFFDLLKRTSAAKIPMPVMVAKRTTEELKEFHQKCLWIADDVRRQRFPRQPRMQFNTPCDLCDYARHCVDGDREGLIFPDTPQAASA